ncbi:AraC family transcriptional regulator [Latilactobacillus curvatus]|uniref:AraC family transcriptional regulator n=1 Tax=Latilactobacillus curvatus TaxID=28038 RepID=UPI0024112EA9|nr:AraC family transcriptional regulator [Latilactobacillus curvatus]MDG2979906.1 AraC family transcriptional regulator [Latilactobacillus curvatus]
MNRNIRDTQVTILWISGRSYHKGQVITSHSHNFYQLQYILSGAEKLTLNTQSYIFHKNNIALIKRATIHNYSFMDSTAILDIKFKLSPSFESFIDEIFNLCPFQITNEYAVENAKLLLSLAANYNLDKSDDNTLIELDTRLKLFLLQVLRNSRDATVVTSNKIGNSLIIKNSKAAPMIHYIKSHYSEHINLQTLSSFSHYSPQNIIKIFKEVTNLTPTHFIQQIRLQKAVELLERSPLSISEVAVKVGFTPNYFTKIFFKNIGVLPNEYRNLHQHKKFETITLSEEFDTNTQP